MQNFMCTKDDNYQNENWRENLVLIFDSITVLT